MCTSKRVRKFAHTCSCACWLFSAGGHAQVFRPIRPAQVFRPAIVTDAQGLWDHVLNGTRDIEIREHLDLRASVFIPNGNITSMADPGLLAPRNTTRSLRVCPVTADNLC